MFAGFSGKTTSVRSCNENDRPTLAGESLRDKGADYATRRLELPTFVWSVVPPGLDSPPPRIKLPKRAVAPPARQAAGPPEARPPRRCLQAMQKRDAPRSRGAARLHLVPSASVAHHGRLRSGGELWRESGRTRAECCFRRRAGRLTAGRRGPPGSSFVVLSGRRGHRLALALLQRPGPPNPPQGCRP